MLSATAHGAAAREKNAPDQWLETAGSQRAIYTFGGTNGNLIEKENLKDFRPFHEKVVDAFLKQFFPVGYPESVSEGYGVYSNYRIVQHTTAAVMNVLSTQSLLFAAGLRPTPAQATVVSWVVKDGLQHVGKLGCSRMGPRMDAEPKRWRLFADALFDVGAALEVLSPLCPQHFLLVGGLANMAKGAALVAARSTRLPIYTSFAKDGNLSDLYAKGEAVSVLSGLIGMGIGLQLASTICRSAPGKLVAMPLLAGIHLFSVDRQMRAAPVSTLDPQRTAIIVDHYMRTGQILSPVDVRYREHIILPPATSLPAWQGHVIRVGAPVKESLENPCRLAMLKRVLCGEKFLLNIHSAHRKPSARRKREGAGAVIDQGGQQRETEEKDCKSTRDAEERGSRSFSLPSSPLFPRQLALFGSHITSDVADLVVHRDATGEDVVKGWLLSACAIRRRNGIAEASGEPVPGRGTGRRGDAERRMGGGGEEAAAEVADAGSMQPREEGAGSAHGGWLPSMRSKSWGAITRLTGATVTARTSSCSSPLKSSAGGEGHEPREVATVAAGGGESSVDVERLLRDSYADMEPLLPPLLEGLRESGWHTQMFLGGTGCRAVW